MILGMHLENIGPFAGRLSVPFPAPHGASQALAVTGVSGKTTLLRALALCLVERVVVDQYPPSYVRLIPDGIDRGSARLEFADGPGTSIGLRLDRRGLEGVDAASTSRGGTFVVAYGSDRAPGLGVSQLFGGERGKLVDQHLWGDVAHLFGVSDFRVGPAVLLRELHRLSFLDPAEAPPERVDRWRLWAEAYDPVRAVLAAALGVGHVAMSGAHGDPLIDGARLSLLGSGARDTLAWLADMVARWVSREWEADRALGKDFAERMEGAAIVDRIEGGLHPSEQRHLVDRLRQVFPRMSFFFSTQSPYVLGNMRAGEAVELGRGPVVTPCRYSLRLRTLHEISNLTLGWHDVFEHEDGKTLHRCQQLASNPYRTDDEDDEMRRGMARLLAEGVKVGFEPEARQQ